MKKLILLLFILVSVNVYSQKVIDYPAFSATKDTSWVQVTELPYAAGYTYCLKWVDLDATDSYLSIYLGIDPDSDGSLDWILDQTLTADSLQLTPTSGFSIITNVPGWTTVQAVKLNYYKGSVSSGTINVQLNLTKQK